jgi:hypothetical protein
MKARMTVATQPYRGQCQDPRSDVQPVRCFPLPLQLLFREVHVQYCLSAPHDVLSANPLEQADDPAAVGFVKASYVIVGMRHSRKLLQQAND